MTASTRTLTVQDALNDIEIELLQGAVTRDDLGQSVQNVRRFQNQVRGETLDSQPRPDYRAIANRQFQINDMLLTLAQEMATRQAAIELELHKAVRSGLRLDTAPIAAGEGGSEGRPGSEELVRRLGTIQSAMRDDALTLQLEVQPSELPLLGRLLGSARTALHSLVTFYSNRLGARQTEINHTFGDNLQWLLRTREKDREALDNLAVQLQQMQGRSDSAQPDNQ